MLFPQRIVFFKHQELLYFSENRAWFIQVLLDFFGI